MCKNWHADPESRRNATAKGAQLKALAADSIAAGGKQALEMLMNASGEENGAGGALTDAQLLALGGLAHGIAAAAIQNGASMGFGNFRSSALGVPRTLQPRTHAARDIMERGRQVAENTSLDRLLNPVPPASFPRPAKFIALPRGASGLAQKKVNPTAAQLLATRINDPSSMQMPEV